MSSKSTKLVVIGAVMVVLFMTTGLALYYRSQAAHYQHQYVEALVRAENNRARASSISSRERAPSIRKEDAQFVDYEEVAQLKNKILELETQLRRREKMIEDMQRMSATETQPESEYRPPRDRRDWMAEMRENDPERYEAIMQRRAQTRQRVQDTFARQAAHFLYRDTENLSKSELEEYNLMLSLLAETWQLSDQMFSDDLSPEDRRDLRRQLSENVRTLRPILADQREREFYEMGRQLGYDDGGAQQFVDYINEMLDLTSMRSIWGGRGGPSGPGGGPRRGGE